MDTIAPPLSASLSPTVNKRAARETGSLTELDSNNCVRTLFFSAVCASCVGP